VHRHPSAGLGRSLRARRAHACVTVVVTLLALLAPACRPTAPAARIRPAGLTPLWSRPASNGPTDLAGDAAGAVVLHGDDRVTAFDASGREQWAQRLPGSGANLLPPAIDSSRVAVATEDELVIFDRADGSVRWRVRTDSPVDVIAFTGPRGGDELVLDSNRAGDLEARSVADGALRWRTREPGEVRARLGLDDRGRVVALWSVPLRPMLRALDVTTGRVLWERLLWADSSAPVVTGDLVLVGTGDGNFHSSVSALALADGELRSQVVVPASFDPTLDPAVDGDRVVVIDHFGTVTAVDPVRGVERWHRDLGTPVLRTRVVIGSRALAVSTADGAVVVLDRGTGRVVGRLASDAAYAVQIAAMPGRVLVAWKDASPERVEAYAL
jgi:outer membrane protein assembly factor BamB